MSFPPPFVSHRVHPAIKKGDFSGPGGGEGTLGAAAQKKMGFVAALRSDRKRKRERRME